MIELTIFYRDNSPVHVTHWTSMEEALEYFEGQKSEGAWHYQTKPV